MHRQAQLQIGILVLTLLLLPIAPSDNWKPADASDPTWRILGLLTVCVGLPYIALATTTPLLSRWLAHIAPDLNPVRFFAASNIGSFLGLLSYPFFFERLLPSAGADALVVLGLRAVCGTVCCVRSAHDQPRARLEGRRCRARCGRRDGDPLLMWVVYSALGSALLIATTNAITQWSAVVPFLWVVPLSALSADLRHRLRLSASLPPGAVRRSIPAAGRHQPCPARAGIVSRPFHRARAADGDAVCRLHDLPWGDGEAAAGACAPAEVLPRHRRGRRAGRHRRRAGRASSSSRTTSSIPLVLVGDRGACVVAHVAARRSDRRLRPDRGGLSRRPVSSWAGSAKSAARRDQRQHAGRAHAQFLRRREDRARSTRTTRRSTRSACSRPASTRAGNTRPPSAACRPFAASICDSGLGLRPRLPRQAPRGRAANAAAHRRHRAGRGHDRDARARGRHAFATTSSTPPCSI